MSSPEDLLSEADEQLTVELTDGSVITGNRLFLRMEPHGVEHAEPNEQAGTVEVRIIPWHRVKEVKKVSQAPGVPTGLSTDPPPNR